MCVCYCCYKIYFSVFLCVCVVCVLDAKALAVLTEKELIVHDLLADK